ncbi:MAG: hypothetical protein FWH11_12190 [Micrococcales bacterium]|nr:hypothetical protein [Micrococcales bacterium]
MSSVLDRWPYSRRSLWIVLGAVVAVVVVVLVVVVVTRGGESRPTATPTVSGEPDDQVPPPTPIPVETVVPGPVPTMVVTAAPMGDRPAATAGPDQDVTDAGVTVRLVSLRPIQTQAYERGDASGPGLAVTIVVTNVSDADLDLVADINLYSTSGSQPLPMYLDGHNSPFDKEKLAPGESAERTAVFGTPNAPGTPVAVQVLIGDGSFVIQATVGS